MLQRRLTIQNLTQQLDAANNENQHNTLIRDDLTQQIDVARKVSALTIHNLTQQLDAVKKKTKQIMVSGIIIIALILVLLITIAFLYS